MTTSPSPEVPPLTPRRRLFYTLLVVYFAWMATLAYLWYSTVHTAPKPTPSLPEILFTPPPAELTGTLPSSRPAP